MGSGLAVSRVRIGNAAEKQLVSVKLGWVTVSRIGTPASEPAFGEWIPVSLAPAGVEEVRIQNARPRYLGPLEADVTMFVGVESAKFADGSEWHYGLVRQKRFFEQFDPKVAEKLAPALARLQASTGSTGALRCSISPVVAARPAPGFLTFAYETLRAWISPSVARAQGGNCAMLVCNPYGGGWCAKDSSGCKGGSSGVCGLGGCANQTLAAIPWPSDQLPPPCEGGE
jgi:hypothetical protein